MSAMLTPASPRTVPTTPIIAGPVVVAHDEHVAGRRHVDGVVVDHHDARLAPQPDQRAGQRVLAAADGDEVDVVLRGGGRRLADLDAAAPRPAGARSRTTPARR